MHAPVLFVQNKLPTSCLLLPTFFSTCPIRINYYVLSFLSVLHAHAGTVYVEVLIVLHIVRPVASAESVNEYLVDDRALSPVGGLETCRYPERVVGVTAEHPAELVVIEGLLLAYYL